jgi:hypothetical protein
MLDVGDRVFVHLSELHPFQVAILAGLCDHFTLDQVDDGPDGLQAFRLQPYGGHGWAWCDQRTPMLTDLIATLDPGNLSVLVMGDSWTGNWAQRFGSVLAPMITVPPPALSDGEARQALIYDGGLLGGEVFFVRMEGLNAPHSDYLRTMCLDVGLETVATSRDGFSAVRVGSGEPKLAGDPCQRLRLDLIRDEAGAVFAITLDQTQRRPVADPTTLSRLAGTDGPVEPRLATPAELARLPIGDPIDANHPSWRFVRGSNGPVYLLDQWHRREVPDEETFRSEGGLPDQGNVLRLTDAQLALIPVGSPVAHEDGTEATEVTRR